jgi:outer membrane protein
MRTIGTFAMSVAVALALSSPAVAQTLPKPPEPSQPATATATVPLFPAEARFAFIDFQRVASNSVSGKLAARILEELRTKKVTEIEAQTKQLEALAAKRAAGGLSEPALAQLGRDAVRLEREIQFSQQNAQAELQQRETELQTDFEKRLTPVVGEIAKEKGLHAVFAAEAWLLYVHPGLDLSAEVIKRLDAQPKK